MKAPYIAAAAVLAVVSSLVLFKAYGPQKCEWRRAAIAIDSGSTQMKVADVDICESKILNVVFQDQRKTDFKTDVEKQGFYSVDTLENGLKALRELKNAALKLSPPPEQFSAVAASTFLKSKNSHAFARAAQESRFIGFPVTIVDQEKENQLRTKSEPSVLPANKVDGILLENNLWQRQLFL